MVAVFFAEGFEEIEAVTVCDVLKRADIKTVSVGIGSKCITGAHGIKMLTDIEIGEVDAEILDMAVMPGGMPGTANLEKSVIFTDLIISLNEKGKRLAAICAAPSILGKLGLLNGVEAICYPGYEKYLYGAVISQNSTVTDGQITTSKGPGTALAFSLELVRRLKDERTMIKLANSMQYEGTE